MSDASFKASYSGGGEILRSAAMRDMLGAKMEEAKAVAEALSEDITGPGNPTHYRDQFKIETSEFGGANGDRAEARLVNDDEQALAVEYGVPAYPSYPKRRILGRALDSLR